MLRPASIAIVLAVLPFEVAAVRGSDNTARPVLYKLVKGSTYQEGCFAPCACPVSMQAPLRGPFYLRFVGDNGLFAQYAAEGVRWRAELGGVTRHILGNGMYRVGGEVAIQNQLELDLVIDGQPRDHFDSGLVGGGYDFPNIDVTVSMHDMFCYDIVLHVRARPLGDANADGRVDAADAAILAQCLSGPDETPASGSSWTSEDCIEAFDVDGDEDIDLLDFAAFAQAFTAPT